MLLSCYLTPFLSFSANNCVDSVPASFAVSHCAELR
jgi:hypothetical protein